MSEQITRNNSHLILATETLIHGDSVLDTALVNLDLTLPDTGRVLDMGSGFRGRFQREVSMIKPDLEVVSIDPNLRSDYYRRRLLEEPDIEGFKELGFIGLAAMAQELPFQDETFDLVISHAAVPGHLPEGRLTAREEYAKTFGEVNRVLKLGGLGIFAPMYDYHADLTKETLVNMGLTPEVAIIPEQEYKQDYEDWFRVSFVK